jgi:hypothetical protein
MLIKKNTFLLGFLGALTLLISCVESNFKKKSYQEESLIPEKWKIEDCILDLPSFTIFHEESDQEFTNRIRKARNYLPENKNKPFDYLFLDGDGIAGKREFILNRKTNTLFVKCWPTVDNEHFEYRYFKRIYIPNGRCVWKEIKATRSF